MGMAQFFLSAIRGLMLFKQLHNWPYHVRPVRKKPK